LVEIQALVCSTAFGSPRRVATGVDYNRMVLAAAVLEKRLGYALADQDIYVNAVGGLKAVEPAVDLGISLALASSYRNRPVDQDTVALGEVGLTGEVRGVSSMEQRLKEVVRLGFKRVLVPVSSMELQARYQSIEIKGVRTVQDALDHAI